MPTSNIMNKKKSYSAVSHETARIIYARHYFYLTDARIRRIQRYSSSGHCDAKPLHRSFHSDRILKFCFLLSLKAIK